MDFVKRISIVSRASDIPQQGLSKGVVAVSWMAAVSRKELMFNA